jgi:hypothetical protein
MSEPKSLLQLEFDYRIDFYVMFGFSWVELILFSNWFFLKIEIIVFDFRVDFYTQIYCWTHFYINVYKHISLYFQLNLVCINFTYFSLSARKQFYIIYSFKINFSLHRTKYTQNILKAASNFVFSFLTSSNLFGFLPHIAELVSMIGTFVK